MLSVQSLSTNRRTLLLALGTLAAAGVAVAFVLLPFPGPADNGNQSPESVAAAAQPASSAAGESGDDIELPQSTWKTAGIEISPAVRGTMAETSWVTGKVVLNEDRVAHVYPQVTGRIESVHVTYGQHVKAGDLLAVVQSREVGDAKLDLFQDRQALRFAEMHHEWNRQLTQNTQDLLDALERRTPMEQIQERFRNRPMGDYREKLLAAYATATKSQADYERLEGLAQRGITPGKDLTAATAARDADQASFQAWIEQARYESRRALMQAEQALHQAQTRVSVAETALEIVGYKKSELAEIDPAAQGESLAHYPLRAPLDGTVIAKDMVLLERVSPEQQVLQIADLSTLWIRADIYEQHLPLLGHLHGKKLRVRTNAYPGRQFEATVAFTGEIVQEDSRTIGLTAVAENADGLLKPGLFVEIELPADATTDVLQVPETAVQEHEGKRFVFLHVDGDRFRTQEVATGRRAGGQIEITRGLEAGAPVVVGGGFALKSRLLADLLAED